MLPMRTCAKQKAPRQRVPVAVGSHGADGQRSTKTTQTNTEQTSMTVQPVISRDPLKFEQHNIKNKPSSTGMRSRDEQPNTNMSKQASWRVLHAKFTRQLELLVVAYHEHAISMYVHSPTSSLVARSGNGTRAKWRLQHAMTFSFRRCESGHLALVHT